MSTTLAIDLGGTRLKAACLVEGVPAQVHAVEHGGRWQEAVRAAAARAGADEIALCVPGLVDGGRVVALPGKLPGIEHLDLAAALALPVTVLVNDAVAYGIGEAACGAGVGHSRVVVVTVGTGVGVAVIEDGQALGRGPLGGGLLGGQLVIGVDGDATDTSGRSGTFEAACRADSLVSAVPGAADVADAYARLAAAEPAAVQGFAAYRASLVRGLTALALAHAPSCLVVGGGGAQQGLLDGVQEALDAGLWAGQAVEVRPALLGDAAALTGLGVLLRGRVTA